MVHFFHSQVLGIVIRLNKNIKGYEYGNNENKILQSADDTNIRVQIFNL